MNLSARSNHKHAPEYNHSCYKQGCVQFDEGKYSRAKALFIEALKYWPEDWAAWMALGNCLDQLERPNQAEEAFNESLRHAPPSQRPAALFNLGNSLFDQGRYSEALECYAQIPSGTKFWHLAQRNIHLIAQKELR